MTWLCLIPLRLQVRALLMWRVPLHCFLSWHAGWLWKHQGCHCLSSPALILLSASSQWNEENRYKKSSVLEKMMGSTRLPLCTRGNGAQHFFKDALSNSCLQSISVSRGQDCSSDGCLRRPTTPEQLNMSAFFFLWVLLLNHSWAQAGNPPLKSTSQKSNLSRWIRNSWISGIEKQPVNPRRYTEAVCAMGQQRSYTILLELMRAFFNSSFHWHQGLCLFILGMKDLSPQYKHNIIFLHKEDGDVALLS